MTRSCLHTTHDTAISSHHMHMEYVSFSFSFRLRFLQYIECAMWSLSPHLQWKSYAFHSGILLCTHERTIQCDRAYLNVEKHSAENPVDSGHTKSYTTHRHMTHTHTHSSEASQELIFRTI